MSTDRALRADRSRRAIRINDDALAAIRKWLCFCGRIVAALVLVMTVHGNSWGIPGRIIGPRGDLNNDGRVDQADLDILNRCIATHDFVACPSNRADMTLDGKVDTWDGARISSIVNASTARVTPRAFVARTTIYNYTVNTSNQRCQILLERASLTLHFPPGQGVRDGDILFCGRYYLAWIDNTGFHGQLNGLWFLNADDNGTNLDFAVPRPPLPRSALKRNMLIAAERRNGRWPDGSSGSIHIEVLPYIPEPDDLSTRHDSDCVTFGTGACNAYSLNEAGDYNLPDTGPWWTCCNGGSPGFEAVFPPNEVRDIQDRGLKVNYETRLTKEADIDRNYDCDHAHADWLFPDGVRRPLYLQEGWELYGTRPSFVQTFRVRNPPGNPMPGGYAYVIHGIELTSLTHPPLGKEFRSWVEPATDILNTMCDPQSPRFFPGGVFTNNGALEFCAGENPMGMTTGWAVSGASSQQLGRSFAFYHVTSTATGAILESDTQPCECRAADIFDIGGGTLTEMSTLPGGATTDEHRFVVLLGTE